ncbi:MAG: pseudouridine synthase [Pseudomonadota bacterium]|nr:pseudouridine synthase [Pseudomonadota bacterium]
MRNGISPCRVWLPKGDWPRVVDFLVARFDRIPCAYWQQRMQHGLVLWADGTPIAPDAAYVAECRVLYYRELPDETPIPFELAILHHDAHLIVVDKPHFLPTNPAGRYVQQTALTRLKQHFNDPNIAPLHRLDRETAGVMLFSCNPTSSAQYHQLFADRQVQKTYEAVAGYRPELHFPLTRSSYLYKREKPFFVMAEQHDIAPNAETRIELIQILSTDTAYYRLFPKTGQQHQLRVHLSALGIGIVNDAFYPELQADKGDDFSQPLQLLARSIAFTDPISGEPREFVSRRQLAWLANHRSTPPAWSPDVD